MPKEKQINDIVLLRRLAEITKISRDLPARNKGLK
jgi:hypothetical protein